MNRADQTDHGEPEPNDDYESLTIDPVSQVNKLYVANAVSKGKKYVHWNNVVKLFSPEPELEAESAL